MIENKDFVNFCMQKLSEKEAEFIKLRYYDELTQVQIAKKWNTSQMYVSRMEKKILKKLKMLLFES